MKKEGINKKSLELHRKYKGKIEVNSLVDIKNRDDLSVIYTPGVAEVSREIARDKGLANELTIKGRTVAVVSDGSAVLGLGNVGPEAAMPVMEGKAALFKEFAGVDAFPIVLSTQDIDEIVETVERISPGFGGINLEDISAPRCFEIERRLKESLDIPIFHDDQHGTAVVVLAGLINALKVRGIEKDQIKVVINGAGSAGVAIAKILLEYGVKHLTLCDSKGPIYEGRTDIEKGSSKEELSKLTNLTCKLGLDSEGCAVGTLDSALSGADVFIGVSKAGLLKTSMIKSMNESPTIFALANPEPEIYPDEAKQAGALIVATGRSDFPNQINNVLAFPGIFKGALNNGVNNITEEMLLRAAQALSGLVESPSGGEILPDVFDKRVAEAVSREIRE